MLTKLLRIYKNRHNPFTFFFFSPMTANFADSSEKNTRLFCRPCLLPRSHFAPVAVFHKEAPASLTSHCSPEAGFSPSTTASCNFRLRPHVLELLVLDILSG